MAFLAVKAFKDGTKVGPNGGGWKHYKAGEHYDGPNAEAFLKAGFIVDRAQDAKQKVAVLSVKKAKLEAEIEALEKQIEAHINPPSPVKPQATKPRESQNPAAQAEAPKA